jgi:hypothetical protein
VTTRASSAAVQPAMVPCRARTGGDPHTTRVAFFFLRGYIW